MQERQDREKTDSRTEQMGKITHYLSLTAEVLAAARRVLINIITCVLVIILSVGACSLAGQLSVLAADGRLLGWLFTGLVVVATLSLLVRGGGRKRRRRG